MKVEKLDNLTEADRKSLMAIWLAGNLDAHPFIAASYWHGQAAKVADQLAQASIYVVKQDHQIVGFAGMQTHYLAGMFVKPGFRDNGIGSLLLFALKSDYKQVRLNVYEKNPKAIRFYQRHDFVENKRGVDPDTDEVELTMKWQE
ncbi:GNAT family N-acetyltransferase [Lactobacillus sp. LC28-10]|uniref:GNAT family N-acetyltransferase n=1 Tax=Secundilactobacillus angelensis TaxID=2722706 RepID=A0ABX1KUQ0_9LACO|nr:GNAT family N-acetyltransferase [Secundilactobacillus angelensis]MCH5461872.1 GNAT family N-acetyltransferase [Secundilactobacillus angelensis]NLR17359.1 GNAT family N-acetyltransferase [Secundilactobacillus angelensis]